MSNFNTAKIKNDIAALKNFRIDNIEFFSYTLKN
jgi:hypothetical protein